MLRDKVLFLSRRYIYNYNIIFLLQDLFFLKISTSKTTLLKTLKRLLKPTFEDNSNTSESNVSISNRLVLPSIKRITLTPRAIKENRTLYSNTANIAEISALLYYYLARNKENKLFSLIIKEIYKLDKVLIK